MNYEVTGKLVAVMDTIQATATFKKREFVIEKVEEIGGRTSTSFIKLQLTQDKTELLSKYSLGEEVKVHFNLRGNKSERDGKTSYFTNLDAWRMESANMMQTAVNQSQIPPDYIPTEAPDDLPF